MEEVWKTIKWKSHFTKLWFSQNVVKTLVIQKLKFQRKILYVLLLIATCHSISNYMEFMSMNFLLFGLDCNWNLYYKGIQKKILGIFSSLFCGPQSHDSFFQLKLLSWALLKMISGLKMIFCLYINSGEDTFELNELNWTELTTTSIMLN